MIIKFYKSLRNISPRAFFERIPKQTREKIRNSDIEEVKDVLQGMNLIPYVDLNSPITYRDLHVVMAAGYMDQDQLDFIVDAPVQEYEKYRGVL